MLDEIINFGKSQLGEQFKNQLSFNDDQVEKTMDVAKESAFDGIKKQVLGGNISSLLGVFNGKSNESFTGNMMESFSGNFVQNLISKMGVSPQIASSISSIVVPFIMEKFSSSETGNADDEKGLLSMLNMDNDDDVKYSDKINCILKIMRFFSTKR